MTKQLTALLLLLATFYVAHAETFIVTSNADSGPGTLREAIEKAAANGTSQTDHINFSISPAGIINRTIALQSVLPDLTSNIIIDASTQPGVTIGVSDAKVRITAAPGSTIEYVFRFIETKNNGVYGFHFDKLVRGTASFYGDYAMELHNADKLEVGAPGKGNYFTYISMALGRAFLTSDRGMITNLSFKSNIVNLTEDGTAILDNSYTVVSSLSNIANVTIGGITPEEGNFIVGNNEYCFFSQMDTSTHLDVGYIKILNNNFGCDITKTKALNCGQVLLENFENFGYTVTGNVSIIGNIFNKFINAMSYNLHPCFVIHNIKGYIDVRSNRINNLPNAETHIMSAARLGFAIAGCGDGRIGGDNPGDPNIIAACVHSGIVLNNNKAITISKNSIYCNFPGITVLSSAYEVPKTKIFSLTDYTVAGTTLPNSKVEVFITKKCGGCYNGEKYLGTVTADNAGKWKFTSAELLDGVVTATGTSPKGVTGEFAKPEFDITELKTKESVSCGVNDGFIKGMKFVSGTRYYWLLPYSRDTVFNQLDIEHLSPGTYRFVVEQGHQQCYAIHSINIKDNTPKINVNFVRVIQPSCNKNNGAVAEVYTEGYYDKLYWKNEAGAIVHDQKELFNQWPGKYKMIILDTAYGCGDSTNYFTLTNQSGPSLITNDLKITNTTCGASNGSIENITASNVTGASTIEWLDDKDQVVGTNFNLENIAGGKYRLHFNDETNCAIYTPYYTVGGASTITIDTSSLNIKPSECRYASGTIEGIQVTGATSYEWVDAAGTIVSQAKDPGFLYSGNYTLIARNESGCEKRSEPFYIPVKPGLGLPIQLQVRVTDSHCSEANGRVQVLNFPEPEQYTFRWVDSLQPAQNISTLLNLENIGAGRYYLYAKDAKSCEQKVLTAYLQSTSSPALDEALVHVTDDLCSQSVGKIEGLNLVPGTGAAPFTYSWVDESNAPVGNGLNLANQTAGRYRLIIKDQFDCAASGNWHTIRNGTKNYTPPAYAAQTIFRNTAATVSVQNFQPGTYQLFQNPMGGTPLQQNETGVFTTGNLPADTTFYIRIKTGSCESGLTPVFIKVVDDTKVFVPTGFTPNKDGKNDDIKPLVLGLFTLEYFTVYDRWGRIVFTSGDLSKGWNGFIKGSEAPIGVYVWLLKGKDFRGNTIQQKGTFTLLR